MFSKLLLQKTPPLFSSRWANNYSLRVRGVRIKPVNKNAGGVSQAGLAAITVGQWAALAAGGLGLASLCSYAFFTDSTVMTAASGHHRAMSNMEKLSLGLWPDYVKSRIHSTYAFLGAGLVSTAVTTTQLFKNGRFVNFMARRSPLQLVMGSAILSIATGLATRALPYPEKGGLSWKHGAFLLHTATIGALLAPVCFVGSAILVRAAICTGGMVGGFSALAMCAPSDRYLNWGGPLAMGLGLVFASSVASIFTAPLGTLGLSLQAFSLYGGLIVFGGFLLYDTQKVMRRAEELPALATYDPINGCLHIYMDAINIFVRMVALLQGGGARRK